MASNQGKGTLYTFPGNFRAYKAQIAAQYSGASLTVAGADKFKMNETNQTQEYLQKFPTGKVPAYENDAGVHLFEANAIAHFLSNDQLRGRTTAEQAQVLQWLAYGEREINPVSATLVYPCMGIMQFNKNNNDRAKEELKHILQVLNQHLRTRTYLVGERITLADVAITCDLLLLFQWVLEPSLREPYPHVNRWFLTLLHQKEVQNVVGDDYKLCEKTAQFDAKKYAELNKGDSHGARAKNVSQSSDGHAEAGKEKGGKKKGAEEKPAKQEKQEKPAKQEKPKKEKAKEEQHDDAGAGDDTDDVYASEPKQNDPFAEMPKSSFNMDEFKRVYSNEDTATKAIPYFWQHFDKENCSVWFCEYKYPEDLSQVFMTCNLVSGFFQRLDKLRKNAFASMCVFGENNNNTICGVWVWRGQGIAFELSSDWKVDYESYNWKKLSVDDENDKKLIENYFLWELEHNGKRFNQGKIFK